jgi:hypothetical protein
VKILVAVMGCEFHAENGIQQMSRETWVQDVDKIGDFKFFIGRGNLSLKDDEHRVDAIDDKEHLLFKVVEILKYALENNYDMIFKLDNDTYVNVDAVSKTIPGYAGYDYIGVPVGVPREPYGQTNVYSFLQGSATWLSARAAAIVIKEAIPSMIRIMPEAMKFNGLICPYSHSEDLWVAQVLMPEQQLNILADYRYSNGDLTFHYALPKEGNKFKDWMFKLHESRHDINKMMMIHQSRKEI